ncbi:MAG TPA: lysozyme inhibitor LprI family protein [Rhizobacter sp.]|jgi:uncharacterized protein YecT (DUF1311 family)|nr:lysozyme inhibitor LprI family protein [Rhizobacter sp.]
MKRTLACLALFVAVTPAFAAGCGKPRNAFDQVYCASTLYSQADKDLNQSYSGLRQKLDAAQKDSLKQGQLSWIKQRDAECSREEPNGYFVNLSCAIEFTDKRLAFLKERERECNSTGCVSEKLGK